jgi:hypothetical protein
MHAKRGNRIFSCNWYGCDCKANRAGDQLTDPRRKGRIVRRPAKDCDGTGVIKAYRGKRESLVLCADAEVDAGWEVAGRPAESGSRGNSDSGALAMGKMFRRWARAALRRNPWVAYRVRGISATVVFPGLRSMYAFESARSNALYRIVLE